uniref:LNS2/PITP domain-containing protein n=1 Tax=Timema tahoe TaxID=61484 RepID=A0A7R9IG07_9NEOP|nr:unnamed protein product [Timema tahoe]
MEHPREYNVSWSDVLGHLFAIVGKDWAQIGVAQLFTKIKNNGYKLLYLSARAIGQAHLTREYLRSIRQNDLTLPDGPLLLSPTSLINAIHREVIEKKPEEFKIPCLKDIKALFPNDINPFYAGYGNKGSTRVGRKEVGECVPATLVAVERKDVPATLVAVEQKEVPVTLVAVERKDVPATLVAVERKDVPATLVAVERKDVPATLVAPIEAGVLFGAVYRGALVTDGFDNMDCGAVQVVERVGGAACASAEERDKGLTQQ